MEGLTFPEPESPIQIKKKRKNDPRPLKAAAKINPLGYSGLLRRDALYQGLAKSFLVGARE